MRDSLSTATCDSKTSCVVLTGLVRNAIDPKRGVLIDLGWEHLRVLSIPTTPKADEVLFLRGRMQMIPPADGIRNY